MTTVLASPPGYDLTCPDEELAAALRQWLDGSCLAWPGSFRITARLVPALPPAEDQREVNGEPGVQICSGPPEHTVRVRWLDAPAEAVVHPEAPEVDLWFTPEALAQFEMAERGFLLVALVFVLRRIGWYHAHGAALIDPTGRGWMLVGNSRTGKSTTSALLASRGWAVSTDDIAFLEQGGSGQVAVRGFRSPIALRDGGRELLEGVAGLPSEGSDLTRRRKTGYTAEELGGRWVDRVIPQVLLFPVIGTTTSVAPMGPREILSELVIWSRWVLYEAARSQEHLDLLGQLASQCRAMRATIGPDLIANPTLLQDLLS